MEVCTKFPTTRKNIHILAYFAWLGTLWESIILHSKTQKRMKNVIKREQCKLACGLPNVNILSKVSKFKVLLYLKKSNLDKQGDIRHSTRVNMNIMPSSLLCKAARPSEATFMLSFEWLETTTTRHWRNWRATFQSAEPQHWCTSWRNTRCSWCRLCIKS